MAWVAVALADAAPVRRPAAGRRSALPWRGGLAWWSMTWLMLHWHLGMVEGPGGERRRSLGAADALTLLRLWLVPVVVASDPRALAWLTSLGGASDLLDGRLARRSGVTRLGRDLDPTADMAFFGASAIAAARAGRLPQPVAAALLGRYGAALAFTSGHYFRRGVPLEVGSDRWASPLVVLGLVAGAGGFRRTASVTLAAASALPLGWHCRRIRVARQRPVELRGVDDR